MIEKEIFPVMASEGQLYGMTLENNFWYDIGQPKDYLIGQDAFLKYYKHEGKGDQFEGNVLIHETAKVEPGAKVGPNVIVGANCHIKTGARIKNSTIFQNTTIGEHSYVSQSIISWDCKFGSWVRVEGLSVIAENVKVKDEVRISSSMIMSQKEVGNNIEAGTILM